MSRASSFSIGRLLVEIASIIFAVALAFAVTNWGDRQREQARGETALARIQLELEANLQQLAAVAPYYAEMVARLDSMLDVRGNGSLENVHGVPGWRGLNPPSVRMATFQVATITGALEHLDFATTDRIAVTYEVLETLSTSLDQAVAGLITGQLATLQDWATVFAILDELTGIAQQETSDALKDLADGQHR